MLNDDEIKLVDFLNHLDFRNVSMACRELAFLGLVSAIVQINTLNFESINSLKKVNNE